MNILMMSNTYTPIVGGIEKSIQSFTAQFRKLRHRVYIVAPRMEGMPKHEKGIVRIPAIQKFKGTDFSVNLPIPGLLSRLVYKFKPDIVHSHHPFLVGDLALRLSRFYHIPLIFTHHIMFEQYIDYFPIHNKTFKRFVIELAAGYANLSDCVIVPSQAVYDVLKGRHVRTPMRIIPTGVEVERFRKGHGKKIRQKWNIPDHAFVVGHVGRIVPEKNVEFLARTVAGFIKKKQQAYFLVVGKGASLEKIKDIFFKEGISHRLRCVGVLREEELADGYHAMDVFAFSSHSETQGLVLLEAMAAGLLVVAVKASGVEDFVQDKINGRLIEGDQKNDFISALLWVMRLSNKQKEKIKQAAQSMADDFSIERCAQRLLKVYEELKDHNVDARRKNNLWYRIMSRLKTEANLLKNIVGAGETALKEKLTEKNPS